MKNIRDDFISFARKAQRIVIKIGSRALISKYDTLDVNQIQDLAKEIHSLGNTCGVEIAIVSSGAVGAGIARLGKNRPKTVPELQMAAAVGQPALINAWREALLPFQMEVAQVLLTYDSFYNHTRLFNAKNTISRLLDEKILPIINENDVVAVDELTFGDNDRLAALLSILINADLLIMLTSSNGFYMDTSKGESTRLSTIPFITEKIKRQAGGPGSSISSGGMNTKLQAAEIANEAGIITAIANAHSENVLSNLFDGKDIGSIIGLTNNAKKSETKLKTKWLTWFQKASGNLTIDSGAKRAILHEKASLLAIGILEIKGNFCAGELVELHDEEGEKIARGLINYDSTVLKEIAGFSSEEIQKKLGKSTFGSVMRRENLVIVENP